MRHSFSTHVYAAGIAFLMALLYQPMPVQAQNRQFPPLSKASRDSLVQAYRQLQKRMNVLWRIDEYHDHKDRPIRYNIIKVDVPNWTFGEPNLGYERKLGHHATAILHVAYTAKTHRQDTATNEDALAIISRAIFYPDQLADRAYTTRSRMVKLAPEVRAYLGRNAPRGFFLGAYYYYRRITWQLEHSEAETITVKGISRAVVHGPGAVLGFQSLIQSRVSLGFEMGCALLISRKSSQSPGMPAPITFPIAPRLNFQLGYCFGR